MLAVLLANMVMAVNLRSAMLRLVAQERNGLLKTLRASRNKAVARMHSTFAQNTARSRDDERTKRMDALKANDFEAYQNMLREQQVR